MKMKTSGFNCSFSVLTLTQKPDMFMMNMQVFNVVPHAVQKIPDDWSGEKPVSVVWCAVFNVKGITSA